VWAAASGANPAPTLLATSRSASEPALAPHRPGTRKLPSNPDPDSKTTALRQRAGIRESASPEISGCECTLCHPYGVGGSCRPHREKYNLARSGRSGRAQPGRNLPDRRRAADAAVKCARCLTFHLSRIPLRLSPFSIPADAHATVFVPISVAAEVAKIKVKTPALPRF